MEVEEVTVGVQKRDGHYVRGVVKVKRTGKSYKFVAWRNMKGKPFVELRELDAPKYNRLVPDNWLRDARAYVVRDALKE